MAGVEGRVGLSRSEAHQTSDLKCRGGILTAHSQTELSHTLIVASPASYGERK